MLLFSVWFMELCKIEIVKPDIDSYQEYNKIYYQVFLGTYNILEL